MGSSIDIFETIEDKKSWFNIKRCKINGIPFEKPEKCLDIKTLEQDAYRNLRDGFKFYEVSKIVRYKNLLNLYNEDDGEGIDKFFCKRDWLSKQPNVINFTFQFNPFSYIANIEKMSWFFNQYYPYARFILTVPNIRMKCTYEHKPVQIISFEDYMTFVDSAYKILDDKNNKPIFVPISMKYLGIRKLTELIQHYLKRQYFYFWFDFEGQPINERAIGKLRHVFDLLKKSENFGNTLSYFTNIRREVLSNSNELTSVASDALSAVAGANLVGVNREPPKYQPKNNNKSGKEDETIRVPKEVDPSHKARIFSRETYYYVKTTDERLFSPRKYVSLNAAKLNAEFSAQSEYFLENQNIDTLLNTKIVFKDEKAGNILKELTSKPPEQEKVRESNPDLTDFLDF
jgi:hypothetical protein